MNDAQTLDVTTPSEREIAMTRVFDAPRHLVFEALTTPALLTGAARASGLGDGGVRDGPAGGRGLPLRVELGGRAAHGHGGASSARSRRPSCSATEQFDDAWYPGEAIVTTVLTDGVMASGMTTGVGASHDRLAEMLAGG